MRVSVFFSDGRSASLTGLTAPALAHADVEDECIVLTWLRIVLIARRLPLCDDVALDVLGLDLVERLAPKKGTM